MVPLRRPAARHARLCVCGRKRKSELEELRKSHSEDHNQVVAHQKEIEAMKAWSEEAKGQMQGRRPASGGAASSAVERRSDGAELGRLA